MLTMAASFLIALVVGMGLRGNWSGGSSHSPDSSLVKTAVDEFPLPTCRHRRRRTAAGRRLGDGHAGRGKSSDGQAETFRVPALRRDALDQNMLENIPDAIPPELQQAFEQSGHRVVQQREIVPVQMKDGRRLVVPVDHIQIHYVGRPSL